MNSLPICVKNYLFITNSADDYLKESYEVSVGKVEILWKTKNIKSFVTTAVFIESCQW